MVQLTTRASLKKKLLESIGNADPQELGRLAIDMMSEIEAVYSEVGIDDSSAGEDGRFSYERPDSVNVVDKAMYDSLLNEYNSRFAGMGNQDEPPTQPPADDIAIQIDPTTGEEETFSLEDIIDYE